MPLLSKRACFEMICDYGMLEHIVAHSVRVCQVGVLLVDRLHSKGVRLDRERVMVAGLLHDITKTRSIETGEIHSETGGALLAEKGLVEVADIVRQHVKLDTYGPDEPICEAEVVNYADKRVLHDRVVSLNDRMIYILERYGKDVTRRHRLNWIWEQSIEMEKKLFSGLSSGPEDVAAGLCPEDFERDMELYHSICRQRGRKADP
jgi:uncharacterized protein